MSSSNLYITKTIEQNAAVQAETKKLARFLVQRGAIDNAAIVQSTFTGSGTSGTFLTPAGLTIDSGVGFNSNLPLVGGRYYKFRAYIPCTAAGAAGIAMDLAGGTATFTSFSAVGFSYVGSTATVLQTTASTGLVSNAAAAYTLVFIEGSFQVNNSGTFAPRLSVNTTGTAATITVGAYLQVTEIQQQF